MALQSFTLTIGALTDAGNNGKNYVNNQPVYIKRTNGTLASIYRDLAGTSQIAQDGLSNVTNSKGQFTFFVEAGDYNAEYQSQVTPITVVGADYFNSRIDETVNQIILDLSTSRGFRVQGTFAAGFTYELPNDVGVDGSGNYWIYTDVSALPFIVPAATTPSAPTYTQVTFNQASNVSYAENINVENALRKRAGYYTLPEAQAADLEVGQYVRLTSRALSLWKVIPTDVGANGYYILSLDSGLALEYVPEGDVDIRHFGAVGDSLTDDSGAIRACMQYCVDNNRVMLSTSGSYLVYREGANAWALKVPSGLQWQTDETALIQLADNQKGDTRVVNLQDRENISIYGTLRIDGAGQRQADPTRNEHMHGFFIFNTENVYIERIYSTNCYGDTVSLSGGDNTGRESKNITIGSIRAETAGRKTLVIEAVQDLNIGHCYLDNRLGGAQTATGGDWIGNGANCLDFEPFNVQEAGEELSATIDTLITRGTGDDFTVGTQAAISDKFHLKVKNYYSFPMAVDNTPIYTNATNLDIGVLRIKGADGYTYARNALDCLHGARWDIATLETNIDVSDSNYHLSLQASSGQSPRFNIGQFTSTGKGRVYQNNGATLTINNLDAIRDSSNTANLSYSQATAETMTEIGRLYAKNINYKYVVNFSSNVQRAIKLGNLVWEDERAGINENMFVVATASGQVRDANHNLVVSDWDIPSGKFIIGALSGASAYVKTSMTTYYSRVNPSGVIAALAGSTCATNLTGGTKLWVNTDGGTTWLSHV